MNSLKSSGIDRPILKKGMITMRSDVFGEPNINKCYVCLLSANETELKRCGACFKVSYCSKAHQKEDWSKHKDFCKVAQYIDKIEANLPEVDMRDIEIWTSHKGRMLALCELEFKRIKANRKLIINDAFIVVNSGRCEICRSKNSRFACCTCLNVNYCSKDHMDIDSNHHSKVCKDFKLMTDVFSYKRKSLAPCVLLRKGTVTLTDNMNEFIESNLILSTVSSDLRDCQSAVISDTVTSGLSLLWGLKCLNYKIQDTFIIHVVGSAADESENVLQWEIILHIYRNIKNLTIILIGPKTKPPVYQSLCKTCKKILKFEVNHLLYHEYVKCDRYQKPDIVCAFNAGFYSYTTWQPSLRFLIESAPFIMSAFNELEAKQDIERILAIKADISVQSKRNPFSGLCPMSKDYRNQISFQNKILSVFSDTSKSPA